MVWTPFTRKLHCRKGLRYASDLTDKEWFLVEPHMPKQPKRGRRRSTDLRAVINTLFYLLQTGCQWAFLPKDFPPNSTVHYYFKRFSQEGTLERIHEALEWIRKSGETSVRLVTGGLYGTGILHRRL
ncbi:transposase [Flexibacterium corallicola]|uniref:transposase n=1 Tax=Flexibacterium corallicola TaxID=3037259 RepID=UPI0038620C22